MEFRIADTFTGSLAKLTGPEQKAAKTAAFDLQLCPEQPGLKLHKLEGVQDSAFRSIRVNRDIRLIVHKSASSLMLCYVDHHDAAYRWARRRKIEKHPTTGAAQLIKVREVVDVIGDRFKPYLTSLTPDEHPLDFAPVLNQPLLFEHADNEQLLGYGIPEEWLDSVKKVNEDTLLELVDHLPAEASEALLELATGGEPARSHQATVTADPFAHPDAQRRFRIMANAEELERALEYPWDKWTVFLHPVQRQVVERNYTGSARVAGSAGTGKTIVALHRAVYLAQMHPDARVLLGTFSDTLASALQVKLRYLIDNQPDIDARIEVHTMGRIGRLLYETHFGPTSLATDENVREILATTAMEVTGHKFSNHFLWTEWSGVVDAWQLDSWEEYRDVARLGRKTRLAEPQRAILWSIFSRLRSSLAEQNLLTEPSMFRQLEQHFAENRRCVPFDFCVIDEAQDVGVPELRFLSTLGGNRPNSLFFSGDLGQRIFRTPFSWRALGVDIRGRSQTLRINYRTSHQIRRQADQLLPPELSDVDGITEKRGGTISVFNGPEPCIRVLNSRDKEAEAIAEWLANLRQDGFRLQEIAIFVRSEVEMPRAHEAVSLAGLSATILDGCSDAASNGVAVGTMHRAKGLEFRAVAVVACDDEVLPLQSRIENIADDADLEDTYSTERYLLYVACTRARDQLLVTGVEPASEFLDDLKMEEKPR